MEPKTSAYQQAEEELCAVEERIIEVRNILAQPLEMKCREAYVMYYVDLVEKQKELKQSIDAQDDQPLYLFNKNPHQLNLTEQCPFVNCGMTSAFAKAIPTMSEPFDVVEHELTSAIEALGSKVQQLMLHFNRSDPSQAFAFVFFADEQDANNLFMKCYSKMQKSWQAPRWFTVVNMWGGPCEIQVDKRKQEKSRHKPVLMCRAVESADCKVDIDCDIKHYSRVRDTHFDKLLLVNDTVAACHEWPAVLDKCHSSFDINTFRCVWKPTDAWLSGAPKALTAKDSSTAQKQQIESALNGLLFGVRDQAERSCELNAVGHRNQQHKQKYSTAIAALFERADGESEELPEHTMPELIVRKLKISV